jgi:rubredoxin
MATRSLLPTTAFARPAVRPSARRSRRVGLLAGLACYAAFVACVLLFGGDSSLQSAPGMRYRAMKPTFVRPSQVGALRMEPLAYPVAPQRVVRRFAVENSEAPVKDATLDDEELNEEMSAPEEKKQKEIARLRQAEQFYKMGTGEYECLECQFVYDPNKGDPEAMIDVGTEFRDLPEDWQCPVCGGPKDGFDEQGKVVAGFAENQGYGFGTNTMTEGQKSALIYGSMIAFFGLFLLGYKMN